MTIYRITYLDKHRQTHIVELPGETPEAAIKFLENELDEQIEVKQIDILDD